MKLSPADTGAWRVGPTDGRSDDNGARDQWSGAGPAMQDPILARLSQSLGGTRGMVDGGLPPILFALVNAIVGAHATRSAALVAAIGAAASTGLVLIALRMARKEPLRQAVGGLAGLALAIAFAVRSGEARGFFLPGIYVDAAYAVAFLVSALIGRPLIGYLYGLLTGHRRVHWGRDAAVFRRLAQVTVGWSLVFAVRAGVQAYLYANDQPALLAASKLLLGWPLTALAVLLSVAALRGATRRP